MKRRAFLIAGGALVLVAAALAFPACASFGARPSGERLERAKLSVQWKGDHFDNPQESWLDINSALRVSLFSTAPQNAEPTAPINVKRDTSFATPPDSGLRVTWFGHSSALVEIDGVRVLTDPLWSERISPVSWAGPKVWFEPAVALENLPPIDAVVISHDHYDHLDMGTVKAIAAMPWNTVFVVPLGIGAHLESWGIPANRIVDLDWWERTRIKNVDLVATPARHGTGRMLSTKDNKALWAGWALIGPTHRAWYSGDTGKHPTLDAIGEQLGPFDVTLIECGQYGEFWPDVHLGPEQAVDAHVRVKGKVLLPVHWARVNLSPHPWVEPIERVLVAAKCRDVQVLTPQPGQSVEPSNPPTFEKWWPQLETRTASEYPVFSTENGDPAVRMKTPSPCESGERVGERGQDF